MALETLALAVLFAQYSLALTATNPLCYVVVMGTVAAFVAYVSSSGRSPGLTRHTSEHRHFFCRPNRCLDP